MKAALCYRQCDFKRLSPAFDNRSDKIVIDPLTPFLSNEKILVCGWPKAGNTWVQALFSEYFSIPLIQPFLDQNRSGVASNHFAPGIDILYRQDIKRCVFIVRDIRDIVCSYYHYAATPFHLIYVNANYDPESTIEQFYYDYFIKVILKRYRWFDTFHMYNEYGTPLIRYEDLLNDPFEEFKKLLLKSAIVVDPNRLQRSIKNTSFKRLKKKGVSAGEWGKTMFPDMPISHFRKGKSGGWRLELPVAIQNDIAQRFGQIMDELGYQV